MSAARNLPQGSPSEHERMDALPTLPQARARLLKLKWIALQGRFRSSGSARAEQTAELAKVRFKQIVREYWTIWKASGEPFEVFRQWLDSIKSLVLTEVDGFWQTLKADWGEPESGIRNDCNWPAVKDALLQVVGHWTAKASLLECQRLEPGHPANGDGSPNHWGEWAFRLSQAPCCKQGEPSVNGEAGTGSVPDSAIEGNSPADSKVKAIESGHNRQKNTHAKKHIPEELVSARYGALTKYRNQKNGQTMRDFARNVAASIDTVRAIVREDKNRYSEEKRDRLLRVLGITLETWNSAEALKQLD